MAHFNSLPGNKGLAKYMSALGALFFLALTFMSGAAFAAGEPERLLQLLDYVAVDYSGTVAGSKVVNASEYAEQVEFAGHIRELAAQLPPSEAKGALVTGADRLVDLIGRKGAPAGVESATADMRALLMKNFPVSTAPKGTIDLSGAAPLFQQRCAACHGAQGRGDGPLAAGLEPKPANFHDAGRQAQRSVFGLYNTITLGVPGTGMPAFKDMSDAQRWVLAFYVSTLAASDAERRQGQALWENGRGKARFVDLNSITMTTVQQARREGGEDAAATLAFLRTNPQAVAAAHGSPIGFSVRMLGQSLNKYRRGDTDGAYQDTVAAYLDGFELAETGLKAVDPALRTTIEQEMMKFRSLVRERAAVELVTAQHDTLQNLLRKADERLRGPEIAPEVSFFSAFGILAREGLEAILIIAAIIAFLTKTGRRDALPYIHAGWIGALGAGFATWFAASYLVAISGASRELTEGVTALLAMAILLYVSFWLINKLHVQRWKQFIESKVQGALSGRSLWLLTAVAFFAVYREVFETVLFFQALWAQTGPNGSTMIVLGVVAGVASLGVLGWVIFRLGIRLPLRQLFAASSALLYGLAVVFAGKGVAALQEAGVMAVTSVSFPRIELLGIYPSLQSLAAQTALVALALLALVVTFWLRRGKRTPSAA